MTFLTDKQRCDWPTPADGFEAVTAEIEAALIGCHRVNTGFMEDRLAPKLQVYPAEEIQCCRAALAPVPPEAQRN